MHEAARQLIALDSGSGDPWGDTMAHWFGIADTLEFFGESIPSDWDYRPGACGPHPDTIRQEWPTCEWADILNSGQLTADDLRHAGNVLCRYARRLNAAGLSY